MMKKKSDLKKDPLLLILIGIEVAFLLLLLIRSFRAPFITSLHPDAFFDNCRDRKKVSVIDDTVVFETTEYVDGTELSDSEFKKASKGNKEKAISWKFPLRSGAYEVKAVYDSSDGFLDEGGYYQYKTGKLSFISEKKQSTLLVQDMVFDDAHNEIKGRLYIPFGSSISDVQAVLSYDGGGRLLVKEIEIGEKPVYRYIQILGFFILFLIIDLLYLALLSSYERGRIFSEYLLKHKEIPALTAIVIMASVPLFAGFLYFGHDLGFHMARLASLAEGIRDMTLPVRVESVMLNGYGYATPLFYCDIFLYPFAVLYLLMVPLRLCYALYVICINVFTAFFSWRFFSEMSGDNKAALCATAFYCLNIYRLTDIYSRAALGEYTALMFIPLAAHGFYRIIKKDRILYRDWLMLAAGMTGIALSHLLSLELMSLTILVYCLIFIRRSVSKKIFAILKAGITSVLLSLWFLVPLAVSMSTIDALAFGNISHIQSNGAYLVQIFALFVSGYGESSYGTHNGMSVELGGGFLVIFIVGIILMMNRFSIKEDENIKKEYKIMNANFVIGSVAVVFSSVYFPWDVLAGIFRDRIKIVSDLMQAIQFPWRYLTIAGIAFCVTLIYILIILKHINVKMYLSIVALTLFMTFVSLCSFYFDFTQNNTEETWLFADNDTFMDIALEDYMLAEHGSEYILKHPGPEIIKGDGEIDSFGRTKGKYYLYSKNMKEGTTVRLPILDYGIYTAYDSKNGQTLKLSQGENKELLLLPGDDFSGTACIYYREPWLYRICEIISLLCFIGLTVVGLFFHFKGLSVHD